MVVAPIPTTALYGAMNALLNIALAANTSRSRVRNPGKLGDNSVPEVIRASRAHGNNAEYVALAIVLMALAELSGGNALWLHIYGGLFFVARVLHAWGTLMDKAPGRALGAVTTYALIAGMSCYVLLVRCGVCG